MIRLLRLIPLILVPIILGFYVFQHRADFTSQYDANYWWNQYQHSQYVQGEHSDYILSDAQLNAIKGFRLMVVGDDPASFPAGHPPFATYLIGLSIKLFGNPNLFSLFAGIITLFFFYQLLIIFLQQVFPSRLEGMSRSDRGVLMAGIITLVFASEPLFLTQLNDSMLDIFQLMFAVFTLYYYFKWLKRDKALFLFISQLSLGLMLSTKFFLGGLPLVVALVLATVFTGHFKKFWVHIFSLFFLGLGFCLGHATFFVYHPSLISLFKYQRYLLSWWAGSPQVPPFQVWDLIFNNRWHTWWGTKEILSIPEWRLTWPIITVLALLAPICLPLLRGRSTKWGWGLIPISALYLWLLGSFFLFSFEAAYPRHLLLIFPALYLLSAQTLHSLQGSTLK